jgi:glycosyltransferase involved in cell wall biosynthesis
MYTPKVSVIIPVYNQEVLVLKALDSIPTRDDIEIIVIDDGSTDDT